MHSEDRDITLTPLLSDLITSLVKSRKAGYYHVFILDTYFLVLEPIVFLFIFYGNPTG